MKYISSSIVNPPKILRLLLTIDASTAPYNQFSLAVASQQTITLCPYFEPDDPIPPVFKLFSGDGSIWGYLRILRSAFNSDTHSIVHTHAPHVGFLFLIASLLFRQSGLRHVSVHTVHSSYPNYKLRNRLMLLLIFTFFSQIICCSQASLDSFPRFFKWLAGERLQVIQNGVDIERVDHALPKQPPNLTKSHFTVVAVGRLISLKQPINILRAFSQIDNVQSSRLVFVGEGELRNAIVAKSEELGLAEQVTVTGLIPREEVYRHLAQANVLVSASTVEGLPVAVLEAMACRCPVVLSDIPPHREIAAGTDFIRLIQPDDVAGFARQIERFRQMSPDERNNIGAKCRQLVEGKFSLTEMLERYEDTYSEVIGLG